MRRAIPLGTLGVAFALAVPATGQSNSFYIDFGTVYGVPSSTYGAASGTGGTWNAVTLPMTLPYTAPNLLNAAGGASAVNLVVDSALTSTSLTINFDSATTFGDDQALLDEGWYVNGLGTMEVTGLAPGTYRVYTYAMAPDSAAFFTSVNVPGSPDPPQNVGGDFASGFVLGVTHAEHVITITAGQSILVETDIAVSFDTICGLQIAPDASSVGTSYCISTTNSTGAASQISAIGSGSISANDLVLTADNLPAQPGIFIAGPGQAQLPFYNGFLCVAQSGLQRFANTAAPVGGLITEAVDLATSAPGGLSVVAGSSYNYQRWNRDPAGGGTFANFSDGIEIQYTP